MPSFAKIKLPRGGVEIVSCEYPIAPGRSRYFSSFEPPGGRSLSRDVLPDLKLCTTHDPRTTAWYARSWFVRGHHAPRVALRLPP